MKFLFLVLFVFSFSLVYGFPCGTRPCTERYYNPSWSNDDNLYYGYIDNNVYPYAFPVNYCFNPRPCPSKKGYKIYRPGAERCTSCGRRVCTETN